MPAAVKDKEMVIDGPRLFGLKTPACSSIPGFFQAPFNGCAPTDMLHNFYCTKKVGHYLIGKTLGEGSFAKVREGLHVITDEKVAIKVIDKHKVKNDDYVMKNLYREGHIHQMIRHPNIAQLLDVMETDNNYYLVTELCLGGNLMSRIYERRHLEEREVQKYIRQLIMAVEHLHRAGVVHRDLKIENLLLDENDNIKLIDFGLSNSAGILGYTDPFSTQCGSPAYAAPELLNRQKYGPKVDVWSIGVNMYAMLTGMLPFTVEPFSLTSLHGKMVNKEMNPLPPDLSPGAAMLLRNLLEPDPVKRPTIQQVVTNPWLHGGQVPTNLAYMNRIHNRDINHVVVLHMTEKLGYKYTDVLSTVNKNRASCVLATYFLLNKKMDRLFKVNMEPVEKEKTEPAQTRWVTLNGKLNIQPTQEPAYLAKMKDSVLNPGLPRPAIIGRDSGLYLGGPVLSSSRAYLEINPILPYTPQPIRRLEAPPLLFGGPLQGGLGFPTSSRIMGVPTSFPVMGAPTSSRIMGVPTSFPVMGAPTSSRIMGVHTSSRVMGVPTSFPIMGAPTSSRIMGVHTSSRVMGVPTSFPVMGAPTSSRIMGVHTSSRVMGVPTSFPVMGAPTSSRIMGVHTSSRVMGVPTSFPAMGASTSSRIMGFHTSSRVMGVPNSFSVMGAPTSSRVMGHSWDTSFQQMNTGQQQLPPWLRVTNGSLPHHTHIQRNAPTPSPSPSPPTFTLTNPGVHARLNMAYTDRHQDRFRAMGIGQILKNQNPPPGQMFRPRMEPMSSSTLSTYHMQTLPYSAFRTLG
ncbi:serine/threonine-protein kinase BRSK2-like [Anguilla anguilla]|uniref:serine/threonine-protein kinase BRSK2-like n=1 Tax=Anguilla anguilla TaxID=7936 RepID=UPI0015ADD24C|nr:serine/threonine-protein kinase BRSK2-like [Anguilla anguilla]